MIMFWPHPSKKIEWINKEDIVRINQEREIGPCFFPGTFLSKLKHQQCRGIVKVSSKEQYVSQSSLDFSEGYFVKCMGGVFLRGWKGVGVHSSQRDQRDEMV